MQPTKGMKQHATLAELKRSSKSFEAIQEAFVLSVLNVNGVGFKARRPERRSQKTLQFLIIEQLFDAHEVFNVEEEIERTCNEYVQNELNDSGITDLQPVDIESISRIPQTRYSVERLKQIKRHKDANRVALLFNQLLERADRLGYQFKMRTTKPSKYTVKMKKICGVTGKAVLVVDNIMEIGKRVNVSIFSRFDKVQNVVEVPPYDGDLCEIFRTFSKALVGDPAPLDELMKIEDAQQEMRCLIDGHSDQNSLSASSSDHEPDSAPPRIPYCVTQPTLFYPRPTPLFHSFSDSDMYPTYKLNLAPVRLPPPFRPLAREPDPTFRSFPSCLFQGHPM